ncbi:MAG: endonuclease domain-containing protein [Clostridiales bacterium]|nr:endonuclease domain-containing protein [Clostridiales bacterium]
MTKEEKQLWYEFLNKLNVKFHRQYVFKNYILDFYCQKKKIAIELDGSQHYTDEGEEKDKERDETLNKSGITVLRYTNIEINQKFKSVCEDILSKLGDD